MAERIHRLIAVSLLVVGLQPAIASADPPLDYRLAWHDEFDRLPPTLLPDRFVESGSRVDLCDGRGSPLNER